MKLSLLFIFSLYTLFISLPAFAMPASCDKSQKQVNQSNNMPAMLEFYYGPIKSIIITSTLPEKGRFKAYKGEVRFDECGSLTKFDSSTQEYIHERIETNLVRMSTPYNIKYKYQLKSLHKIYTLYLHEVYGKNNQNQLIDKTSHFYDGDGSLIGTDFSKIFYDGSKIASETIIESSAKNQGSTIYYSYDNEGRLLKAIDNNEVMLEFNYDENGKVLHQMQIFTSMYDDIREYDSTCQEWDKYNNCLTWNMVSEVRKDDIIIDTSTATIYNKFEYYE
ncbi:MULTISPECIES: hypothetical protein [Proteus]|uniref:hypothetical protein n=3 Tax=Morganellaceae TaxID=1903414 RepID=UPI000BFD35F3|nr:MULTISPECIES: hypothetical protein [Proteus]ATN00203.1 hypothetical protein CRN77_10900 [Proteus vulgaris]MBG2838737.1 hypothetical protein [Proteus terrae subsp. cibarius]MBG2870010.1 hypothetical protein [Proteus terrae subsp. cibarius]MBJ2107603.1 hypothetical protein [Proteus terrae]MBJ2131475.1 hypothetical protein [Proteus terrae]